MIAVMLHCVSNRVDMRTRTLGCPAWSSCPPPRVSPRCSPGLYRRLRASWGRGPLQLSLWSHHYTRLENTNRSLEHWWKSKSDQWKQSFKCQTQTFVMLNINKRIHSLIKPVLDDAVYRPLHAGSVSFHCGLSGSIHSMVTDPCSRVYPGSQANSTTAPTAHVLSLLVRLPYFTNGS